MFPSRFTRCISVRRAKNDGHAYHACIQGAAKRDNDEGDRVIGDFNNKIGTAAMNSIEQAGMRPTWKDLKIDLSKQFTWNALNPKQNHGVIDHILYNTASGAKATDGAIIEMEKPLSDHKPVWPKIVFPRKLEKPKTQ